jgi:hypothetical protein
MTRKGSFTFLALGLGGMAYIAMRVSTVTRRSFLKHIECLRRALEQSPKAWDARADLPPEVLALASSLGASDDTGGRVVRLTQWGDMWLKPGSRPLAFSAEQTMSVVEVGFLWRAWLRMAGLSMQVIDYMVGGKAGLEGRLLSSVPMVQVTDTDAMFRGEAMRYLAELMWNPDAILLNRQLTWRVLNARTLAVSTGEGARRCEVRLILDEAGDLIKVETDDRPRQNGRVVVNCPWFGRACDYRTIGGRRMPTLAEAGWLLDGVEFIYWRGHIASWSLEADPVKL